MKRILSVCIMFASLLTVFGQTVTLTFTGRDANNNYCQLNRIVITNLTKNWQETITWPDTTLTMQVGTGIDNHVFKNEFILTQNNPNPFNGITDANLIVAEPGEVSMEISDVNGRIVAKSKEMIQIGVHLFRVQIADAGIYFMTARLNGKSSTIKMVNNGQGTTNMVEYVGMDKFYQTPSPSQSKVGIKGITTNPFSFGDYMEYVGYATINGVEEEGQRIEHAQGSSQTFIIQFSTAQILLPSVITANVTSITQVSAVCGGNVTADGGAMVSDRGVCYNTTGIPTISDSCIYSDSGIGSFSKNITGLTPGTTYYVRAFAINSAGVSYGNQVDFTTLSMPIVITDTVSNVTTSSARCGGDVISEGSSTVTARGVCYSTSQNPTINNSHTTNGTGIGGFTSNLTGLYPNTTFYVRAYATNNVGTSYGNQVSFTTLSLPVVNTFEISDITDTSATCGGNITSTGSSPITARGVCWSTSQNPTINNSHTTNGTGMGGFTSNMTGLLPNTTYYVRAYATNSVGTNYGQQKSFTTEYPCPGHRIVTDYDGNTYNTVQIGQKCWMKENLRTTRYANGASIPLGSTYSFDVAYRYYPNNDSSNVALYGYLYNWKALMDSSNSSSSNPSGVKGICPTGWHVPSSLEWYLLFGYVRSQNQFLCGNNTSNIAKSLASKIGWESNTTNCSPGNNPTNNNTTGFSAVPAGGYNSYSFSFGSCASYWGASESSSERAFLWTICNTSLDVLIDGSCYKFNGGSVRCVLNEGGSSTYIPTVSTNNVSNISSSNATLGGSVTVDGGSAVIERGLCYNRTGMPTISDSVIQVGSGLGNFTQMLTGLSANTTYYVRAYAINSEGVAYGNAVVFTTTIPELVPCPGAATVTDLDGHTYNTVQIGSQCWMRENLITTSCGQISITQSSVISTTTAYCFYPDWNIGNVYNGYGFLYNWKAVMGNFATSGNNPSGVQGICPTGWHVPSIAEWMQLTNYVKSHSEFVSPGCTGTDSENQTCCISKSLASSMGWSHSNNSFTPGNNLSYNNYTGFSAPPAGIHHYNGSYSSTFGLKAIYWSSTEYDSDNAYVWRIEYDNSCVSIESYYKGYDVSVRCVKD